MKRLLAAGVLGFPLMLGGCTTAEILPQVVATCQWVPTANLVTKTITAATGLPPGAGVGIEVAQQVVAAICAAAEKKKSGTRSLVFVEIGNKRIRLEGRPAR
jgi:hypothetical protein